MINLHHYSILLLLSFGIVSQSMADTYVSLSSLQPSQMLTLVKGRNHVRLLSSQAPLMACSISPGEYRLHGLSASSGDVRLLHLPEHQENRLGLDLVVVLYSQASSVQIQVELDGFSDTPQQTQIHCREMPLDATSFHYPSSYTITGDGATVLDEVGKMDTHIRLNAALINSNWLQHSRAFQQFLKIENDNHLARYQISGEYIYRDSLKHFAQHDAWRLRPYELEVVKANLAQGGDITVSTSQERAHLEQEKEKDIFFMQQLLQTLEQHRLFLNSAA